MYKNKIFLGGTTGGKGTWDWRRELIPMLPDVYDYFDPYLREWETDRVWDEEAQIEEKKQRKECEYSIFVVTSDTKGIYSYCEAVADSILKNPGCVIVAFLDRTGEYNNDKSIKAWLDLCKEHGAYIANSLDDISRYLRTRL